MTSPASGACRLFVAVSLPGHVKDEIESAQDELRGALPGDGIRWTRRTQFHLTLKFLGDVEPGCVDPLTHALRLACEEFGPLPLCARGLGVFPKFRRPRLIWVGEDDARARLPLLQHAVEMATAGCCDGGPEPQNTPYVGLGRPLMFPIGSDLRPHPDNGGKARFFAQLGYSREDPDSLVQALRNVAAHGKIVDSARSTHGEKYVVDGHLSAQTEQSRQQPVRTVWIMDRGAVAPRLVTAYPGKE